MNKDCKVVIKGFDVVQRNGVSYKNIKYSYGDVIYGCVVPYSFDVPSVGSVVLLSSIESRRVKLPPRK